MTQNGSPNERRRLERIPGGRMARVGLRLSVSERSTLEKEAVALGIGIAEVVRRRLFPEQSAA